MGWARLRGLTDQSVLRRTYKYIDAAAKVIQRVGQKFAAEEFCQVWGEFRASVCCGVSFGLNRFECIFGTLLFTCADWKLMVEKNAVAAW